MLEYIKKYQGLIGYALLLIAAVGIFIFRIVYRHVGFNTLYDEAYFLFKLGDAYNGIIAGDSQWNFIAIHLFPYLNLYDKADAYFANILLHVTSVVVITIVTCYSKNFQTWLKYLALYSAVYTLSMYVNQELTYVSIMVFFLTLTVSLCMVLGQCEKSSSIALCCTGVGFVVPWTLLSVLPSGALILLCIFILLLSCYWGHWVKLVISVVSGILGIVLGFLFVHFFIINLGDTYDAMCETAKSITTLHRGYDPLSFVMQILVVGKGWLLTISICAIVYALTTLIFNANSKLLTVLGGCAYAAAIFAFYLYHPHIKTTEALLFSTIAIIPFVFNFKVLLEGVKRERVVTYLLLLLFPLIASMGTNIYLGQRMGCFMFSYVVLLSMMPKTFKVNSAILWVACAILMTPSCRTVYDTLSSKNGMALYSDETSPISKILLEKTQAEYFERIDSILQFNHFDKSIDYALAVNEDFATLYALNIANTIMPYTIEDIIYDSSYDSIIPKCIFIAQWELDRVVEQTNNKWGKWGFPNEYERYEVGSPDAYRGENTDRLLFIKKYGQYDENQRH